MIGLCSIGYGAEMVMGFEGTGVDILIPQTSESLWFFENTYIEIYSVEPDVQLGKNTVSAGPVRTGNLADVRGAGRELVSALRIDDLENGEYVLKITQGGWKSFYGAIKVLAGNANAVILENAIKKAKKDQKKTDKPYTPSSFALYMDAYQEAVKNAELFLDGVTEQTTEGDILNAAAALEYALSNVPELLKTADKAVLIVSVMAANAAKEKSSGYTSGSYALYETAFHEAITDAQIIVHDREIDSSAAVAAAVIVLNNAVAAAKAILVIYGDVNGDGMVNATDIKLIQGYIKGDFLTEAALDAADINQDQVINTTDMVLLQNYIKLKRT